MKKLTPQQAQLLDMLPIGAEHPQQGAILAQRLNVPLRALNHEIAYLVNVVGVPIGSSRSTPAGYYIISNDDELNATTSVIEAQAKAELKRVYSLRHINLDNWHNKVIS